MIGDTNVEPAPLFDLQTGRPPADALDVYFSVPTSLSLFGDALAQTPKMEHLLPRLADVYHDVLAQTLVQLQRMGGYVEHPTGGASTPARLELTARSENQAPGESIMRIHGHIYVGRTATALSDGSRCPVDLYELRTAADDAWRSYLRLLQSTTASEFGLTWGTLPNRHPSDVEIVEPPFAPHVSQHRTPDQAVCPGFYGPLERIAADEQWRSGIAASVERMAADRRRAG
ncbi:hypothetical protein [Amycolatopsis sp. lyj-23]|uniref:hypothetical protein n=1 Tax=Amycolatopsis sp. lyj-23 TaxID=2789283 RepID=UPI003978AA8A